MRRGRRGRERMEVVEWRAVAVMWNVGWMPEWIEGWMCYLE